MAGEIRIVLVQESSGQRRRVARTCHSRFFLEMLRTRLSGLCHGRHGRTMFGGTRLGRLFRCMDEEIAFVLQLLGTCCIRLHSMLVDLLTCSPGHLGRFLDRKASFWFVRGERMRRDLQPREEDHSRFEESAEKA